MEDKNEYVLVIGSKPNSEIPKIEVSHIYTANGSAERGSLYKKFYPKTFLTSVVGGRMFEKDIEVRKRVIDASPDVIISRRTKIDIQKYNFSKNINYKFLNNKQQLIMQSDFLKFNFLDLFLREIHYEIKIKDKILRTLKSIIKGNLLGCSTGLFAILIALKENPDKKVIISGIGVEGGGQYYDVGSDTHTKRARVDRKLFFCLREKYKNKLFTTEKDLSEITGIKMYL